MIGGEGAEEVTIGSEGRWNRGAGGGNGRGGYRRRGVRERETGGEMDIGIGAFFLFFGFDFF